MNIAFDRVIHCVSKKRATIFVCNSRVSLSIFITFVSLKKCVMSLCGQEANSIVDLLQKRSDFVKTRSDGRPSWEDKMIKFESRLLPGQRSNSVKFYQFNNCHVLQKRADFRFQRYKLQSFYDSYVQLIKRKSTSKLYYLILFCIIYCAYTPVITHRRVFSGRQI